MNSVPPMEERVVLGVESSCDDTSMALLRGNKLLGQVDAVQLVHTDFGGVVPELASRAHQVHIGPVMDALLEQTGLDWADIDAVAYTRGPGLHGSLLVGSAWARSVSWALGVPLLPVHHMRAHILAHWVEHPAHDKNNGVRSAAPNLPAMGLTVSGGHTQLVRIDSPWDMEVVGETLDDAAGEAFDKVAKWVGLPYPGGPEVDRRAALGDPAAFTFSKPVVTGLDFSFSGLKTSVLSTLRKSIDAGRVFDESAINDVCAALQQTLVEMLVDRLEQAAIQFDCKSIAIQGGVSANSSLRKAALALGEKQGWSVHIPQSICCTDNGAMVAMAGQFLAEREQWGRLDDAPLARWPGLG
ncbi:MAG: tRNA (adenosine(37)-N6)-threonylcarbamoyltransferase complex transferase subunit TsaD [Flavobacteriales bacterium]|nr:tRNA (adenosine(37)-N6)-threonylcarbamoyltransferase complex transferase subunit TsaD [Flavobacteriales bacterium]